MDWTPCRQGVEDHSGGFQSSEGMEWEVPKHRARDI